MRLQKPESHRALPFIRRGRSIYNVRLGCAGLPFSADKGGLTIDRTTQAGTLARATSETMDAQQHTYRTSIRKLPAGGCDGTAFFPARIDDWVTNARDCSVFVSLQLSRRSVDGMRSRTLHQGTCDAQAMTSPAETHGTEHRRERIYSSMAFAGLAVLGRYKGRAPEASTVSLCRLSL